MNTRVLRIPLQPHRRRRREPAGEIDGRSPRGRNHLQFPRFTGDKRSIATDPIDRHPLPGLHFPGSLLQHLLVLLPGLPLAVPAVGGRLHIGAVPDFVVAEEQPAVMGVLAAVTLGQQRAP